MVNFSFAQMADHVSADGKDQQDVYNESGKPTRPTRCI